MSTLKQHNCAAETCTRTVSAKRAHPAAFSRCSVRRRTPASALSLAAQAPRGDLAAAAAAAPSNSRGTAQAPCARKSAHSSAELRPAAPLLALQEKLVLTRKHANVPDLSGLQRPFNARQLEQRPHEKKHIQYPQKPNNSNKASEHTLLQLCAQLVQLRYLRLQTLFALVQVRARGRCLLQVHAHVAVHRSHTRAVFTRPERVRLVMRDGR